MMQEIVFNGQKKQLPGCWQDVSSHHPEQLPSLLQLVYFTADSKEKPHKLLPIVLGIRPRQWKALMELHFSKKKPKKVREANAIVLHELLHQIRWMQTEPILKRPFPSLLGKNQLLLLPDEDFLTMSFGELSDAYIHFLVWLKQLVPGDRHLDLLVATLCRAERQDNYLADEAWNGDKREAYNEFATKELATQLIAPIELGQKLAVLLYFAGTMQQVLSRYQLFDSDGGAEEEYPGQGWLKNQHILAEKGIFGTMSQVKATNLHDVLLFLEENKKDIMAQNERSKQEDQQ